MYSHCSGSSELPVKWISSLQLGEASSEERKLGEVSIYRGERDSWKEAFAITAPNSRHGGLLTLVGTAFCQTSRDMARRNAVLLTDCPNSLTLIPAGKLLILDEHWRCSLARRKLIAHLLDLCRLLFES